jgi:hypothetical protein
LKDSFHHDGWEDEFLNIFYFILPLTKSIPINDADYHPAMRRTISRPV